MDLRLALHELTARHGLDEAGARRLRQLAGLDAEPRSVATGLARGVAVLAAALVGLGVIFWIAANWESLGRFGRFALFEAVVVVACVGAMLKARARSPLGLAALLATGGRSPTSARPTRWVRTRGSSSRFGPRSPCRCAWRCAATWPGHPGPWSR